MTSLTSRERIRRALDLQEVDYVPCSFMSFSALRNRHGDDRYAEALAAQAMGLDTTLFIPSAPRAMRPDHPDLRGLPVRFHPAVRVKEWREGDTLYKEYATPAGKLSTGVRLTEDWPYGDHIPFVGDYQVPRATKPLITAPDELPALQYLLQPPCAEDVAAFQKEVEEAQAFVREHDMLLIGGWGVGMDMADWLCGIQELMVMTIEQPAFVKELVGMIHAWNVERMKVVLAAPVDLYIRRAWYEGCDFITPRFFREAILPGLKAEADLAHERGCKLGYICSSGLTPMLDPWREAGIDALIGVDPIQGTHTDMPLLKKKLGDRVCLWGGVSGAVTVETGTEEEVRAAVRLALDTLGPKGLILSPVDNITVDAPRTWENVAAFIDEWQKVQ